MSIKNTKDKERVGFPFTARQRRQKKSNRQERKKQRKALRYKNG